MRELRTFLMLAEELHFARAAERLELTPSRVSQTISMLETRLGTRLLDRPANCGWRAYGGSAEEDGFLGGRPPDPRAGTASLYIAVGDPDAVHARATQAGAEIVRELTDTDYGSREFSVRDPGGNLWSFGS